jgi:hypothetical protein
MYGMKGGGGTTTGSQSGGSASGGSAAGGNAPAPQQMDIGNLIQAALASAQIEKIKAETENLKAGTQSTGQDVISKTFNNEINASQRETIELARQWQWDKEIISGGQANAAWEFKKAIDYHNDFASQDSPAAKARKAEMNKFIEDLKLASTNNKIADAEAIIREFEANLQKEGISRSAPWFAKLVVDLLTKAGITTQ